MFLEKDPVLYAGLLQVIKRVTAKILEENIKERYGLSGTLECFQAAFLSDEMPAMDGRIGIRVATEDDIQMILEHYDRLEDWELEKFMVSHILEKKLIPFG